MRMNENKDWNIDRVEVRRVTKDNYFKYDDAVYWRLNKRERSKAEKEKRSHASRKELSSSDFMCLQQNMKTVLLDGFIFLFTPKIGKWKKGHLFVDEMWVMPDFRRKGVAMKLLTAIETVKQESQLDMIRLITDTEAARKLYEKYGFETVGQCVFMEKSNLRSLRNIEWTVF